jgi:hypothetical protein
VSPLQAGPQKDESPTVAAAGFLGTNKTHISTVVDLDADRKAFSALAAKLAIAGGFAVYELSDGSYLVARHDRTLHCADLRAVHAFYQRVTEALL